MILVLFVLAQNYVVVVIIVLHAENNSGILIAAHNRLYIVFRFVNADNIALLQVVKSQSVSGSVADVYDSVVRVKLDLFIRDKLVIDKQVVFGYSRYHDIVVVPDEEKVVIAVVVCVNAPDFAFFHIERIDYVAALHCAVLDNLRAARNLDSPFRIAICVPNFAVRELDKIICRNLKNLALVLARYEIEYLGRYIVVHLFVKKRNYPAELIGNVYVRKIIVAVNHNCFLVLVGVAVHRYARCLGQKTGITVDVIIIGKDCEPVSILALFVAERRLNRFIYKLHRFSFCKLFACVSDIYSQVVRYFHI